MNGLIRKDCFILKHYLYSMVFMLAVFTALAWFLDSGPVMIPSMLMFTSCTYFISLFTYDEYYKWEGYCRALPVSGAQIVSARYIVGYGGTLVIGLVGLAAALALMAAQDATGGATMAVPALLSGTGAVTLLCLLCTAVAFPLSYRFGGEKARYLYIGVLALLGGGFLALALLGGDKLPSFALDHLGVVLGIALTAILAVLALSWRLSINLYKKREF